MPRLLLILLLLGSLTSNCRAASPEQTVLHLLDYISVEYPEFVRDGKVVDAAEYAEQVEFSAQVEQLVPSLPANPARATWAAKASELNALIKARHDGPGVAALAREIQRGLIQAYNISVTPQSAPDLTTAQALYASNCASCHGLQGDGKGPLSKGLEPAPSDFTDHARQSGRSVYGLYNTISLGVDGTAMTPFDQLNEEDRWRLAFFVSQFAADDAQRSQGASAWNQGEGRTVFSGLAPLVTLSPFEAGQQMRNGATLLAFLRAHPERLTPATGSPIDFSITMLNQSLDAYRTGNREQAYQLAVTAYLEGFELVEASLDNADSALRTHVEQALMSYRQTLRSGAPLQQVETQHRNVLALLTRAQSRLDSGAVSTSTNFASSLIIILREGLEAILVLAAMAAFLVKTGRRAGLPWLHAGWIAALAAGVLTWVVSSRLLSISGAQREVTEGVTALISAAMLIYVGFWLHNKANVERWGTFIKQQMSGALAEKAGSISAWWAVALVAFLAVYREVFETVLFYQALWLQSAEGGRSAVLAGFAMGSAILVALAWLIARFSVRLPVRLFFGMSSVLLALMAVVFAGQGIAALQEAGKLPVDPVNFPSVPLLGIYPNAQGLGLQLVLLAVVVSGFFYARASARPTA